MIMTYYEIGTIINQRKVWGNKYIERLSNDLREYRSGYSTQNLYRMSQIANEYTKSELFSQPEREIPWYTLVEIMTKSKLWFKNNALLKLTIYFVIKLSNYDKFHFFH